MKVVISLLVGLTGSVTWANGGTREEIQCMQAVTQFLNVSENEKYKLEGVYANKPCTFSVDYRVFTSGISNEIEGQLILRGSSEETFSAGANLYYNGSLVSQKIKKCEVRGNQVSLDIVTKKTSGWRKKYRYSVQVNKNEQGQIVSTYVREQELGAFSRPRYSNENSCRF